jgi:hypothetical protein
MHAECASRFSQPGPGDRSVESHNVAFGLPEAEYRQIGNCAALFGTLPIALGYGEGADAASPSASRWSAAWWSASF